MASDPARERRGNGESTARERQGERACARRLRRGEGWGRGADSTVGAARGSIRQHRMPQGASELASGCSPHVCVRDCKIVLREPRARDVMQRDVRATMPWHEPVPPGACTQQPAGARPALRRTASRVQQTVQHSIESPASSNVVVDANGYAWYVPHCSLVPQSTQLLYDIRYRTSRIIHYINISYNVTTYTRL